MIARAAIEFTLLAAAAARAEDEGEDAAPAATPAAVEARARFAEGDRRYAHGDYPGAERDFLEAIRLNPELPGPWRNLGLVYVAEKRCADATPRFLKYLALRPRSRHTVRVEAELANCRAGPARAPVVSSQRPPVDATAGGAATELALVTVTVSAQGRPVDGALVRIDGLARGGAPLDLQVTPGRHLVTAEKAGYPTGEVALEVRPNRTAEVDVPLGPPGGAAKGPTRPSRRRIAWGVLGAAAVGLALGAAFGILESANWQQATTLDRSTHVRSDLDAYLRRGETYAALSWTGYAVGGAALAASAVLFLLDAERGEAHGEPTVRRRVRFAAGPIPGGAVAAAAGAW
jgi:tetratricopeptide (TPR) repeat protein